MFDTIVSCETSDSVWIYCTGYLTYTNHNAMPKEIGLDHGKILDELFTWLEGIHPICFLDGFSGVGKTYLADCLIETSQWKAVSIEIPIMQITFESNLMDSLMKGLRDSGYDNLANAIDPNKPLVNNLIRLLQHRLLVILDDFQHAFDQDG